MKTNNPSEVYEGCKAWNVIYVGTFIPPRLSAFGSEWERMRKKPDPPSTSQTAVLDYH